MDSDEIWQIRVDKIPLFYAKFGLVGKEPQSIKIIGRMCDISTVFTARGYAKRGICRRRVSVCVSVTLRY